MQPLPPDTRCPPRHAFLIGQDDAGHWVAIETHGLGGGLFATRDAALHYARGECDGRSDAILLSPGPMRLDCAV